MSEDSNTAPLAALLAEVVKTGKRPAPEQIQELKLRSTGLNARRKLRHQISEVGRILAEAVRDGEDPENVNRYVAGALRQLGGETGDHHPEDLRIERTPIYGPSGAQRPDLSAHKRLASELRHSAASRERMSDADLSHIHARDGVDTEKFRQKVREASERVAKRAATGDLAGARELSTELGLELGGDMRRPERHDPAEAARGANGEYDPVKLADLIPR